MKGASGYTLVDAKKIVLTIQNDDGTPTKYTSSELNIHQMNGAFFSQKLMLRTGSYRLTEFLIKNSTDTVIFTTPSAGSDEARNVSYPLPIAFEVFKDISSPVSVEVLSTENNVDVPAFRYAKVKTINVATAIILVSILNDGGDYIIANGSCWATTPNPTLSNAFTSDNTGSMFYQSNLSGLQSGTTYYVRAYATNGAGTGYSEQIEFTTLDDHTGETGTVCDIDGNTYPTIGIGSQIWMAENLKTTKFNDGTDIPLVTDSAQWMALSSPAFCWYNNDAASYKATYGALYNWFTLDSSVNEGKNACPVDWHVPTEVEWNMLSDYIGGEDGSEGGRLKEAGTTHWNPPNTDATNEYGFTALPGGIRANNFEAIGDLGSWWSATKNGDSGSFTSAWGFITRNDLGSLHSYDKYSAKAGMSVRCVKNN